MLTLSYQTAFLSNGLKVVVYEDHSLPKVVLDLVYRVGAKDEDPDLTGFAHLFEHLMFEGSKHVPAFDRPLQAVGGSNNAFTTQDVTNYYITVPSNQIETAFWLESDRMLELGFSQEKLDIQKSVVIEEFKQRYLNQPYGDARNRLFSLHFTTHPYHWPTIGKDISHIEQARLEDVKDFFFGFYAPNNATLIVAGDVNPDEAFRLAEKWFGPIPVRTLKKKPLPQEPPQRAPRTETVYGKVPFPAVYKMFHVPGATDTAFLKADLLSNLLSNGRSSLLHQHMTRKRKVSPNASAFVWGHHDPGALSVEGRVADGATIEQFEKGFEETVAQLADLNQDQLAMIKGKLEAEFVVDKTALLQIATSMAMYDAMGDIDRINTQPDLINEITLDELKTAAAEYFHPSNCSTLYYLPQN